jgi:hypothetical protein
MVVAMSYIETRATMSYLIWKRCAMNNPATYIYFCERSGPLIEAYASIRSCASAYHMRWKNTFFVVSRGRYTPQPRRAAFKCL